MNKSIAALVNALCASMNSQHFPDSVEYDFLKLDPAYLDSHGCILMPTRGARWYRVMRAPLKSLSRKKGSELSHVYYTRDGLVRLEQEKPEEYAHLMRLVAIHLHNVTKRLDDLELNRSPQGVLPFEHEGQSLHVFNWLALAKYFPYFKVTIADLLEIARHHPAYVALDTLPSYRREEAENCSFIDARGLPKTSKASVRKELAQELIL